MTWKDQRTVFPLHAIRPAESGGGCACTNPECKNAGKHPACSWGNLAPGEKIQPIDRSAGCGIATGERSGIVVIDIDEKKKPGALERWQAFCGGTVTDTYTVRTGSGGWHCYFEYPGFRVPNSSDKIAFGVDVRGDGGYVVAPGSPHVSGNKYEEVNPDTPLAPCPPALLAWLSSPVAAPKPTPSGPAPKTSRRASAAALLGGAWPEKGRHYAQLALAGALRRDGWSQEDAVEFLCDVCRAAGNEDRTKRILTCRNTWSAKEYTGWTTLESHVDRGIVNAARGLLDPEADMKRGGEWIEEIGKKPGSPTSEEPPKGKRMSAADRARRIGGYEVTRLPTGFYTVDFSTRGGILMRKLVVIGGAPGAGKTAVLVRWGFEWLSKGFPVGMLATDEDADAILIRFGQLAGISRDALESGEPSARERLAEWCDSVPLLLCDGDEDGTTIEQMSAALKKLANGRPSALLIDSMQTARCEEEIPRASDLRLRVNATMRALKKAAKSDGHVVVASSELSKAAYRNQKQAENINALSAFKESGDIEYGVSLALVLVSCSGTSDFVDAAIVKNRLGQGKPEFLLKLDHERADVRETRIETERIADPDFDKKKTVRDILSQHPSGVSKNVLCDKIGGRRAAALSLIAELLETHALHEDAMTKLIRFPFPGEPGYQS